MLDTKPDLRDKINAAIQNPALGRENLGGMPVVSGRMVLKELFDIGSCDGERAEVRIKALEVCVKALGLPEIGMEAPNRLRPVVIIDDI